MEGIKQRFSDITVILSCTSVIGNLLSFFVYHLNETVGETKLSLNAFDLYLYQTVRGNNWYYGATLIVPLLALTFFVVVRQKYQQRFFYPISTVLILWSLATIIIAGIIISFK